jgi:Alcohol dehydrogenase, class IV
MDALAHSIECYTNKACQPISSALAYSAMELIGGNLRGAVLESVTALRVTPCFSAARWLASP